MLVHERIVMSEDRYFVCSICRTRFVWTPEDRMAAGAKPDRCPACRLLSPSSDRQRGLVKFYNSRQGWGFITPTQGAEVFFHRSALADPAWHPLHEGDLLEFGLEQTARGPQAVAIQRLETVES